ncbi:MAG: hypothetical protein ACI4GD_07435 [Lachnospiraceae bacterium]
MSICVYGRIKRKCINEDLLEGFLVEFFSPESDIIRKNNEKCVIYEGISNKNKVSISFISEKKPPYNIYDSNIINDEFEYIQLIIFEIDKEEATIDNYKEIINFCIFLKEKIDSDILVTSDVHDDICLLEGTKVILSKDISFDSRKIIQ